MEKTRGNNGREKGRILALGELLVDLIPGEDGMRIEDEGPVIKRTNRKPRTFCNSN